ncbi:MAG: hypothetical protein AB7O67_19455 [Vicinamibacterales bacterium]
MTWAFLVNQAPFMMEFLGRLASRIVDDGGDVLVVANGKVSEHWKGRHFPREARRASKIDWLGGTRPRASAPPAHPWSTLYPSLVRKQHVLRFDYPRARRWVDDLGAFLADTLDRERPDVVVSEPPANLFTCMAAAICADRGIPYLGLMASRIEGHIDVYDRGYTSSLYASGADAAVAPDDAAWADGWIDDLVEHRTQPAYQKYHRPVGPLRRATRYASRVGDAAGAWGHYLRHRGAYWPADYESEAAIRNELQRPWQSLASGWRARRQGKWLSPAPPEGPYVVFPLQVQPEASTSVQAPFFYDQVATITAIAQALPYPMRLAVKEHPSCRGERRSSFYRRLHRLPNVVVVSPACSTRTLLAGCQAVVTLTSTVGLEAALDGVPTFILGRVFYEHHPMCRRVASVEALVPLLAAAARVPRSDLQAVNRTFVLRYRDASLTGDIGQACRTDDTNDYGLIRREVQGLLDRGLGVRSPAA